MSHWGLTVTIFDGRWGNTKARIQGDGEHIRDLISLRDKMWSWHLTFSLLRWRRTVMWTQTCTGKVIEREIWIMVCQASLTQMWEKNISLPFYQHPCVTPSSQLGLNDSYPVALSSPVLLFWGAWRRTLKSEKRSKWWKSSHTETKEDKSRPCKRWVKLIGFTKSFSNSRSQCGSTIGHYR